MKKYLVVIFLLISLFSCRESGEKNDDCLKVREILIINGANEYLMDSSIVTDRNAIDEYCVLLSQAVVFDGRPKVKINTGLFRLIITYSDNRKQNLEVIYTVYDGIIIRHYDGGFFKQDKLVDYILRNVKDK